MTLKHYFLLFVILPIYLLADWEQFSSNDKDPSVYNHVDVISGNLNLAFQDGISKGGISLPIIRAYTSSGALERDKESNFDLYLKSLRGDWIVQGGWNFFSHADLLINKNGFHKDYLIYIPEMNGNLVTYEFSHFEEDYIFYKPKLDDSQALGSMSARTNIRRNLLRINTKTNQCWLFLANGAIREYKGILHDIKYIVDPSGSDDLVPTESPWTYFRLVLETTPSKHKIRYDYDHKKRLNRISARSPDESKTFCWINFDMHSTKQTPFEFTATTSDNQTILYKGVNAKDRDYLADVLSNSRSRIEAGYEGGREGTGARVNEVKIAGKSILRSSYYVPPKEKDKKKRKKNKRTKTFDMDKVRQLQAPISPNGEMVPVATFSYSDGLTEVRDVNNLLIKHYHTSGKLDHVDYHDENDQLSSSLKLIWNGPYLKAKIMLDNQRQPVLSKTFQYDEAGNVIEESFWGNLTGKATGPFTHDDEGRLQGAECYLKRYTYDSQFNVPLIEEEEGGVTYRYTYLPGTDLVMSKFTCDKGKVLLREFKYYNSDNLLVGEIRDDGSEKDLYDLTGVTIRNHKQYELDSDSGLVKSITEKTLDPQTNKEVLLRKIEFTYSSHRQVIAETVYDSDLQHRYTLQTEYDSHGNVISQTDPLGRKSVFVYDDEDRLITSHEPGKPIQKFSYNSAGNVTVLTKIDSNGHETVTTNSYDIKGHLLSQTDFRGYKTVNTYDCFGHCLNTQFPIMYDDLRTFYHPMMLFTYDIQGNVIIVSNSQSISTHTSYNALRKPICIIRPDGTETRLEYTINGNLAKTIHPDGTQECFSYDALSHVTCKETYNRKGELVAVETWTYNAFVLLKHTDANGLTTHFKYDGSGRKITEEAEGRIKTYSYDALGFLEKSSEKGLTHVQIHDVAGRVVQEWDEQEGYPRENQMQFFYDANGRKEKAIRITSQGEAIDLFAYDGEGRLIRHTDPLSHVTQYIYDDYFRNELYQTVLQKTTIDPLGNQTVETYDIQQRLAHVEKKDPEGQKVSDEQFFYDRSGNRTQRISSVYLDNTPIKTISCQWEHDSCGRVIKEIEAGQKMTHYSYDRMGRIIKKTLPDGTIFSYAYDCLGRFREYSSSDKTIHYCYHYDNGSKPVLIEDLVQDTQHERIYNLFGQLIAETNPCGISLKWHYDVHGRCSALILHDGSSIQYAYHGAHLVKVQRYSSDGILQYEHEYAQFDQNGHVTDEQLINNLGTLTSSRDLLERFASQTCKWLNHSIQYGPSGLVTYVSNSLNGDRDFDYDPLNQLQKEGNKSYHFDSLGNPAEAATNDLNQITEIADCKLTYDSNGNPISRSPACNDSISYTYDALGRLLTITSPSREIRYFYDSFSRLLSKDIKIFQNNVWVRDKVFYLYDQDYEIGALVPSGDILQLKVLGLGIKGDIGAAVALELKHTVYAPLHDSVGNIIAIIAPDGTLAESYNIDAFGRETSSTNPTNPWRFASKRSEEGLFFFGLRFYDPELGRWLTPDPSGFTDGPNLYAYVLNNPTNRLDVFGLWGNFFNFFNNDKDSPNTLVQGEYGFFCPISEISRPFNDEAHFNGYFGKIEVDAVVFHKDIYNLHFSEYEMQNDRINLFDHLDELIERSSCVQTYINGIRNSVDDMRKATEALHSHGHPDALTIGLYNRSEGTIKDVSRARKEIKEGKETKNVAVARRFLTLITDSLSSTQTDIHWYHGAHSEGGALTVLAIKRQMESSHVEYIKNHMDYIGLAPGIPMSKEYVKSNIDFYSKNDGVTLEYAKEYLYHPDYNIIQLDQITPKEDCSWGKDHGIKGNTLQFGLKKRISDLNKQYGVYGSK
ncbi:MAG TPA: RHS repeat-associated core domain-containing protein [Rhabdochlamydiaceae bacterium]|nr:RHS repeat-associated core domain-containing protein [Rhabdochlamydiaceae bacterium]